MVPLLVGMPMLIKSSDTIKSITASIYRFRLKKALHGLEN